MQKWVAEEMRFGSKGEPDLAALRCVLVTDDMHRLRSQSAELESDAALVKHPLPAAAQRGGALTANPNSKEQILLTRGDPTLISYALGCSRACSLNKQHARATSLDCSHGQISHSDTPCEFLVIHL